MQHDKGDFGAGLSVVLPDAAMAAARAGGNASTDPAAFGAVRALLLVLPVEAGPSDHPYGSGLALVRAENYHNTAGAIVATPRFAATPWFCDGNTPNGTAKQLQATYIREVIAPLLLQMYCPGGGCPVDLVGFSKSGWGALSLLFNAPAFYRRVAAWDAPSMLSLAFCRWMVTAQKCKGGCLWDMMTNIGDCEAWARCSPHELVAQPPPELRAPNKPRMFLAGQHYFGDWPTGKQGYGAAPGQPFNHTVDMHARMRCVPLATARAHPRPRLCAAKNRGTQARRSPWPPLVCGWATALRSHAAAEPPAACVWPCLLPSGTSRSRTCTTTRWIPASTSGAACGCARPSRSCPAHDSGPAGTNPALFSFYH